jgi:aldehyde:ferredoxin oxidoreductase
MEKSFGWAGKILFIDLTSGSISHKPTTDYAIQDYIGGLGLNTRIFWDLGCPAVEAFHPDNPLIISTGPLAGTYGPFGRAEICSIAPQAYPQELFTYSSFGGRFPSEMKFAGYDGIVITGKAKAPVYLSIRDGEVEIKSAEDIWGVDTYEAQQNLLRREPGAAMTVIGPAGENRSRIAVILSETKFACGGGGFGGVMGSKNLKAIAVRGSGSVNIANPEEFIQLTKLYSAENKNIRQGTTWRGPYMSSEGLQQLYEQKYYQKQTGCYGCPKQCHSIHYVPGIGIGACSCLNWQWSPGYSNNPKDIWEANQLIQKIGINSGEIIPGLPLWLKTAYKTGILSTKEVEDVLGLPAPAWLGGKTSDHDFMHIYFNRIASGESPYSDGAARVVAHFAPHLKHTEELQSLYHQLYTARGYSFHHLDNLGSVLHWATDTRDPQDSCHEYKNATPEAMRHFGLMPYDDYQTLDISKTVYEGAEKVTAWVQVNQCLKNSLPICEWYSAFSSFLYPPEMDTRIFDSKILTAVTGINTDTETLARIGERAWTLRRAIMVKRENRTRKDDTIYAPYFEKAITCEGGGGRATGLVMGPVDRAKFESLKDRYYELMGWDTKTGWPQRARLAALGLTDVADKLETEGKLPA